MCRNTIVLLQKFNISIGGKFNPKIVDMNDYINIYKNSGGEMT